MTENSDIHVIETKLDYIQTDIKEIKKRLNENYVTNAEFEPVKKIVYGLVTIVLTSVSIALIALIITNK
jgi:hypothetical protein